MVHDRRHGFGATRHDNGSPIILPSGTELVQPLAQFEGFGGSAGQNRRRIVVVVVILGGRVLGILLVVVVVVLRNLVVVVVKLQQGRSRSGRLQYYETTKPYGWRHQRWRMETVDGTTSQQEAHGCHPKPQSPFG